MPQVGIAVFTFNSSGHLVLGRRKGSHGAGTFALPGGHLEHGESFEGCASREVAEETGLAVTDIRFLTATNSVMAEEGKHYVTVFVGGRVVWEEDPKVMEPEKCDGWDWVTWEDVKRYSDDNHGRRLFQPILDLLRQRPGFDPLAIYSRG